MIEFKYKIKDTSLKLPIAQGVLFSPAKNGSVNLACYDCWHDIERIEKHKLNRKVQNGFFILITNDSKFWTGKYQSKYGPDFNMKSGSHMQEVKKWNYFNKGSLSEKRKDDIGIKQQYDFDYKPFVNIAKKNGTFNQLIVEI